MMNKDRRLLTEKILNFTLEIIYLLTGEDCIVVKNPGNHGKEHANPRRTQIPGTEPPPHPLMDEKRNDKKILELTNAIIQLLTGEVPVRCEDVTVYFSTEEWEYLEGHRELYNGTPVKNLQLIYPNDKSISRRSPMKCHPALTFSDMVNRHSSEKASHGVTAKEDCTENKTARSMYPSISNEGTSTGQNENLRDGDLAAHRVNHWVEYRPTNRDATATGEEENLRECDVYRSLGYPSNSKEEQMAKVQNEDLRDTIISTHTVTPPLEYMSLHIKKESDCKGDPADRVLYPEHLSDFTKEVTALCDREGFTEHDLYVPAQIEYTLSPMKEESSSCEGQYDNDMQVLMDNAETEHIKEESSTWDEENHTDIMSTERTAMKYPSIHIKEEPDSWEEVIITDTDIYAPPEHAQMGDVLYNDSADPTSENNDARSPPVMSFRFMKFNECGEIINNKFHTHTVEGMYNCSDCQKCFANNFDVFRHQAAHKDKMLACPECGKDFSCKARLIRHYRSHTGTKLFSCSECGKRLTDKSSLITHQRSHMGDKPFSCDVCRKSFTTQSDLVRHQRTHTGEKPFSCPDCGKCFSQSSHLLRHQRLHTGDKTFMCFVCRTSFPDKLSLAAHHRIHAGENPFLCTVCGKSFFTQEDLGIHQRVHLEDQTFLCFACGKCFPESAQLTRHLKSHTAEDQFFGPI